MHPSERQHNHAGVDVEDLKAAIEFRERLRPMGVAANDEDGSRFLQDRTNSPIRTRT